MALKKEAWKTVADIEALPEGTRAELIDGVIYDMASPSSVHQELVSFLNGTIWNYIHSKGGKCKVFPAPYDVQLDEDDYTLVQPDISVICDRDKIRKSRCVGSPDWIIEIVSPATKGRDYLYKLNKYQLAGVREYWIVDPLKKKVIAYDFQSEDVSTYDFCDTIPSSIYPDLGIDFSLALQ